MFNTHLRFHGNTNFNLRKYIQTWKLWTFIFSFPNVLFLKYDNRLNQKEGISCRWMKNLPLIIRIFTNLHIPLLHDLIVMNGLNSFVDTAIIHPFVDYESIH